MQHNVLLDTGLKIQIEVSNETKKVFGISVTRNRRKYGCLAKNDTANICIFPTSRRDWAMFLRGVKSGKPFKVSSDIWHFFQDEELISYYSDSYFYINFKRVFHHYWE